MTVHTRHGGDNKPQAGGHDGQGKVSCSPPSPLPPRSAASALPASGTVCSKSLRRVAFSPKCGRHRVHVRTRSACSRPPVVRALWVNVKWRTVAQCAAETCDTEACLSAAVCVCGVRPVCVRTEPGCVDTFPPSSQDTRRCQISKVGDKQCSW